MNAPTICAATELLAGTSAAQGEQDDRAGQWRRQRGENRPVLLTVTVIHMNQSPPSNRAWKVPFATSYMSR